MFVEERELVADCLRGHRPAWRRLVREHDWKISKVLWRMGAREELDDLRQEVWARLLKNDGAALRGFRGERPGALRVFLGMVARSVALDHFRTRRAPPEAVEEHAPDPETALIDEQRRALLARALDTAAADAEHPARDRDILRLHFEEGHSPAEIAAMGIGLSARGVEAVIRRARARLEKVLEGEGWR